MATKNGTVKNFNSVKGFGFITDEENKDYFFHFSSINMEGYKTIKPGAKVTFEPTEGDKGLRAVNITEVK
ncbi:MAG: cold shock domain-containing protein [Candidatus Onthovivens sp.]|nr:cold shock domain-containing protein [Mollicutes bacterium]MDD6468541.1 cold shock domain-containing protein [Bacilli bacterium]MDY2724307.1 cold shock domain-containing protein [Candidatus Onthovivens sp.]MCI6615062.1 cold shock domain-containing protein [Mollicutes bacterium]MCI7039904.1 cold shock domain-containing protein [Mollicutes bacterium]